VENKMVVTKNGAEIMDYFPRDEILVAPRWFSQNRISPLTIPTTNKPKFGMLSVPRRITRRSLWHEIG